MLGDRQDSDSDSESGASDAGEFARAIIAHSARADHYDLAARDDGKVVYQETPFNVGKMYRPRVDESAKHVKASSYSGAIAASIAAARAATERVRPSEQETPAPSTSSRKPKATATSATSSFKPSSSAFRSSSPVEDVPARGAASRGRGRGGRGRGGGGGRGRGAKINVDRAGPLAQASGGWGPRVKPAPSVAAEEAEQAQEKKKKKGGKSLLMSGSDLLSNLGLWDQKGKEKGKSGTAKTRTKAKAPAKTTAAKGKGKGKSVKEKETEADDESDISGIEILPDDGPNVAAPAKRKAPAKGKAATTSTIIKASPAKKGGKRKKDDEGAVKFGMLPDDINTNDNYPLTAAMKRQRALPTRPAKKAKVADYDDQSNVEAQPESDPSDFTKAEKLKHGTQRLLVQLFPEGREGLKKRKEKAESVHGSEWGADSVNPDDEDDILDEEREEGEKEGKQFVMSRFFDPDTPNKDMPNMPMLDGSDLPSPLLRKMAPAEAKRPDLYNPSNLTGYVNNDPLTPGHDRTSSILPYSSPIADRSLKRQNSKLLHPQPKKAWSVELEKLKKVAAMKGEALERKARERGSTGSAEEDGKPAKKIEHRAPYIPPVSKIFTGAPKKQKEYHPFAHIIPAIPSVSSTQEWGTLPTTTREKPSFRRSIPDDPDRHLLGGFGDTKRSSGGIVDTAPRTSGPLSGRKLFKPSQAPAFETAPEKRPVFRSSGGLSRSRPGPITPDEADVFGQPERYNPLQKQMEEEAAIALQEDTLGYRYGHTQPIGQTYGSYGAVPGDGGGGDSTTSGYFGARRAERAQYRPRAMPAQHHRSNGFPGLLTPSSGFLYHEEPEQPQMKAQEDEDWDARWRPQDQAEAGSSRLGAYAMGQRSWVAMNRQEGRLGWTGGYAHGSDRN